MLTFFTNITGSGVVMVLLKCQYVFMYSFLEVEGGEEEI